MITLFQVKQQLNSLTSVRKVIRKYDHLYTSGINNRTPTRLAEEILDCVEIDWSSPSLKFLDVKANCGTFSLLLVEKLLDAGHHIDYILDNMIWCIDSDIKQIWLAEASFQRAFGRSGNIIHGDFLTWDFGMQFDVVVGNPPFKKLAANGRQTNKSLWKDFIVKSVEVVSDHGTVCLVTPTGWGAPSDNGKLIDRIFSKYDLVYADISDTVKNYFGGVSSTFGYTITVKREYSGSTNIKTNVGVFDIDVRKTRLITQNGLSVIKKLTESSDRRCEFKLAGKSDRYPNEGYHNNDKPTDAVFPNIHHVNSSKDYLPNTTIPVRWSTQPSPLSTHRKIVIPYNGPTNVIVDDGYFGIGWCQFLLLEDKESVEGAKSVFGSNVFKFFSKQRHTQYVETKNLNLFPRLDMSRTWSDQELYDHFELTSEEIILIESSL